MSASFMNRHVVRTAALAAIVLAGAACSEQQITGNEAPPAPVTANPSTAGMLRGTVREDGTVLLESLDPSIQVGDDASGAIYGNPNVTARVTTSQFSTSATSTTRTWTFKLAVHNLLNYPVGAIDGGSLTPQDTIGMYVFFPTAPTAVAPNPCSGCAISILNTQGTANFTGPGQQYYWYHDLLAAKGQTGDSTKDIPTWTFTASNKVTSFRFTIILSSPWPRGTVGGDTTWSVFYNPSADSFPTTNASPRWKAIGVNYNGDSSVSSSALVLNVTHGANPNNFLCVVFHICNNVSQDMDYFRSDNLNRTEKAYAETRVALTSSSTNPVVILALADSVKFVGLGVGNGRVGFVTFDTNSLQWEWIGAVFSVTTTNAHTYRIGKFGATNATIYVDGAERLSADNSVLPNNFITSFSTTVGAQASHLSVLFGITAQDATSSATFNYATYAFHATPKP